MDSRRPQRRIVRVKDWGAFCLEIVPVLRKLVRELFGGFFLVKVTQSRPTLRDPMDYAVHGIFQARVLELVALPFPRGSSQPRMEPRSPALQVGSLPAEPQGKPKDTGVGIISLFQQIFLIQESNWDLLHCRRILYQLSYEGRHPPFSSENRH